MGNKYTPYIVGTDIKGGTDMIFTVEEENLCCIFNTSSRNALISGIRVALGNCDDPEIREIADSTLRKLDAMTDAEFDTLDFSPTYNDEDMEV